LSSTIQVTCNVRGFNHVSLKNVIDAIYYAIIKPFNILIFIICEEVGFGGDNAQKLAFGAYTDVTYKVIVGEVHSGTL